MAVKKKAKAKSPKQQAVKAEFIHIRKIPLEDRRMLYRLVEIFGKKQNPKNLVRAAHGFLELRNKVETLTETISGLEQKVDSAEQDQQALIEEFCQVLEMENERLQLEREIEKKKQAFLKKYRASGDKPKRGKGLAYLLDSQLTG